MLIKISYSIIIYVKDIKTRTGALQYPIYTETMKLSSLDSHSAIIVEEDELPAKKLAHEQFLENGTKVNKSFNVFLTFS